MLTNGTGLKLIGRITIEVLENGHVGLNCQMPDPMLAFDVFGKAISLLSVEVAKQKQQQIQVADAGLINRLPQG